MGLDVAFGREQALSAGMQVETVRNGTDAEVQFARQAEESEGYIFWLESETEVLTVPGTDIRVANDGLGDRFVVRANKWGSIYHPLTEFLKANHIEWDEF